MQTPATTRCVLHAVVAVAAVWMTEPWLFRPASCAQALCKPLGGPVASGLPSRASAVELRLRASIVGHRVVRSFPQEVVFGGRMHREKAQRTLLLGGPHSIAQRLAPAPVVVHVCSRAPMWCTFAAGHLCGARLQQGTYVVHVCSRAPMWCIFAVGHLCGACLQQGTCVVRVCSRAPMWCIFAVGRLCGARLQQGTCVVHVCSRAPMWCIFAAGHLCGACLQ